MYVILLKENYHILSFTPSDHISLGKPLTEEKDQKTILKMKNEAC